VVSVILLCCQRATAMVIVGLAFGLASYHCAFRGPKLHRFSKRSHICYSSPGCTMKSGLVPDVADYVRFLIRGVGDHAYPSFCALFLTDQQTILLPLLTQVLYPPWRQRTCATRSQNGEKPLRKGPVLVRSLAERWAHTRTKEHLVREMMLHSISIGGFWLNQAESLQRISGCRAPFRYHPQTPEQTSDWLTQGLHIPRQLLR
jgi:hypothetical protein